MAAAPDVIIAYIDPGSGSLLLQFLLAGLIGTAAFFRTNVLGFVSWVKQRVLTRKS